MFKLTMSSLIRLVTLTALALAAINYWPRSLPKRIDGSITWYHGIWGPRNYYLVTGTDRFGCSFRVEITDLPAYSPIVGRYPDGTLREKALVYVTGSIDGALIHRSKVLSGEYYAPNGKAIGTIEDGTGTVVYCRPDGTLASELELSDRELKREKQYWKSGTLKIDQRYEDGELHGTCLDYYPNGKLRSKSIAERNRFVDTVWYDQTGRLTSTPDPVNVAGEW